ncbi:molybdenum cofactor synthesis domain-containing protein [Sporomusaceae bacterium BoRhaA]|uniref:molybdopterin-binding protein n=1 Tax=Pelorhabdus rhamnosifermentans TaxID=2772457 RepID=UPI001C06209B|nr:molybdopterin-binding protein [Pelorhabdus rhamnosifermentans]MBU2702359.1 molybdenum cofactor synthesis domain-containing protein [Pelorhabdus rhamnosifermentans]
MEVVNVEEAVGNVLCHDITKIIPGEYKGRAFKKGHIITEEDIPELLKLGKEHIYVWKMEAGKVHENEAGIRLAQAVAGTGLVLSEPKEGKVNLVAAQDGLCMIDEESLLEVNMIEELIVATRSNNRPVQKGDIIAGVRAVPLVIEEEKLLQAEQIGRKNPIVLVKPFHSYRVGIITTGSEVYHGRIQDQFGPVVKKKVEHYGCQVLEQIIVPDDAAQIAQAVQTLIHRGAELLLTTGGMSVDPDDVTPTGIKQAGATIVTYGAPVLPGAMLMVAYLGTVPILGLPGCVMYNKTTVFDLVLPLVLSGQTVTRPMVVKLGLGGLCLKCEVCHYPVCSFGTGA